MQTLTTVGYVPVFSTPKTKRSRRALCFDVQTVAVLRARRCRQREERLRAGQGWGQKVKAGGTYVEASLRRLGAGVAESTSMGVEVKD